jgi:hypothetical protein
VALARSDRKLMLITGGVVIVAALFFASVLVFATGSSEPQSKSNGPLYIGPKRDLVTTLNEGSPLYFANPFGGRGFWLDRENGELIALDVGKWGDVGCSIKWRGRVDSYVDCDGNHLTKDDLARHAVTVVQTGTRKGSVLVDLESVSAPPSSTSAN